VKKDPTLWPGWFVGVSVQTETAIRKFFYRWKQHKIWRGPTMERHGTKWARAYQNRMRRACPNVAALDYEIEKLRAANHDKKS